MKGDRCATRAHDQWAHGADCERIVKRQGRFCNTCTNRKWRLRNPESYTLSHKLYSAVNAEFRANSQAIYYAKNRDKRLAYMKQWRAERAKKLALAEKIIADSFVSKERI